MSRPARTAYRPLNARQAKQRIRRWLILGGLLLALPVAVLLTHVYRQLQQEAFYRYQAAAMQLVNRINERFYDLLKPESERPFDHYNFWSVPQSGLVPKGTLSVSPLAQLPPLATVPGIIGYYQIDPDGSFHSPVVPENAAGNLGTGNQANVSDAEQAQRLALRDRLRTLLQSNATLQVSDGALHKPSTQASAEKADSVGEQQPDDATRIADAQSSLKQAPQAMQAPASVEKRETASSSKLKLDDRLYRETQKLPEGLTEGKTRDGYGRILSQQPRKEILNYLERGAAADSSVAAVPEPPARSSPAAPVSKAAKETRLAGHESSSMSAAIQVYPSLVKSMAGEIYPIEFELLPDDTFAFFRKVWRDQRIYLQGLLVDGKACLHEVLSGALGSDPAQAAITIAVRYRGQDIPYRRFDSAPSRVLLHRAALATPLSNVELVFSTASLPLGSGLALIVGTGSFLALLIPGVLYGVYRLGRAQIDLAQQRSNFVSAVSHELRTPLTSIRMYSEILRAGWSDSDEKRQSYYDFIFFECERLSRLISNVLTLSRLSSKDLPLPLKPYAPDVLLEGFRAKLESMAEAAGFELSTESVPTSLSVEVEEDALNQIVINLVDNAIKFSRNAGCRKVAIGIRTVDAKPSSPPSVVFYVRDYGPGIDPAMTDKIFDLFTRGEDELTRSTPGTGIGLALVRELAHKLNAQVRFELAEPGVEFQVWLPALPNGA